MKRKRPVGEPSLPPGLEAPIAAALAAEPVNDDEAIASARADIAAGRFTDNAEVEAWLRRWGEPDPGSAPRPWLAGPI